MLWDGVVAMRHAGVLAAVLAWLKRVKEGVEVDAVMSLVTGCVASSHRVSLAVGWRATTFKMVGLDKMYLGGGLSRVDCRVCVIWGDGVTPSYPSIRTPYTTRLADCADNLSPISFCMHQDT